MLLEPPESENQKVLLVKGGAFPLNALPPEVKINNTKNSLKKRKFFLNFG